MNFIGNLILRTIKFEDFNNLSYTVQNYTLNFTGVSHIFF